MRVVTAERVRNTYLGGHEIGALMGVNRYQNAADVYAKIVNKAVTKQNPRMLRGLIVEPGLLDYVEEQRKVKLERDTFWRDDTIHFFGGSVDGVEHGLRVIHECKTTLSRSAVDWGTPGTDEVPPAVFTQVQWYMMLTGAIECRVWLMILDADEEPRQYIVPRDDKRIAWMRAAGEDFWWNHVVPRVPPSMAPVSDPDAFWPKAEAGKVIEADEELRAHLLRFAEARARRDEGVEEMKVLGESIKTRMGDAERAYWAGGSATWKAARLKPSTSWEEVAHELAQHAKVSGEVFRQIEQKHTREGFGSRALRVTIKDKK